MTEEAVSSSRKAINILLFKEASGKSPGSILSNLATLFMKLAVNFLKDYPLFSDLQRSLLIPIVKGMAESVICKQPNSSALIIADPDL